MRRKLNINLMSKRLLLLLLSTFLTVGNAYSYSTVDNYFEPYSNEAYPTDEELKNLAIQKNVIDSGELDMEKLLAERNTIIIWLILDRQEKIQLIDAQKKMQEERAGAIIRKSAVYYVDEINGVLWNSINNGDIKEMGNRGLGKIFKTIAIMDGDYDDGRDKVEIFKEWFSEDILEAYKKAHPDRFNELVETREKTIDALGE